MTKKQLVPIIVSLMVEYEGEKDFLTKVADHLNEQGVRTLKGKEWTPQNLWNFKSINSKQFAKVTGEYYVTEGPIIEPPGVNLGGWGMRSLAKRNGWVPVVVSDPELFDRVERRLVGGDRSPSKLIEYLLREWLEKQELADQRNKDEANRKPRKRMKA